MTETATSSATLFLCQWISVNADGSPEAATGLQTLAGGYYKKIADTLGCTQWA